MFGKITLPKISSLWVRALELSIWFSYSNPCEVIVAWKGWGQKERNEDELLHWKGGHPLTLGRYNASNYLLCSNWDLSSLPPHFPPIFCV
jgi:hypothetical protein